MLEWFNISYSAVIVVSWYCRFTCPLKNCSTKKWCDVMSNFIMMMLVALEIGDDIESDFEGFQPLCTW